MSSFWIRPNDTFRLFAGFNRLEACKVIGWQKIPAHIVALSELKAELTKINGNLVRNELTVLEREEQLKRGKEINETMHPEAEAYGSKKQHQQGKQKPSEIISPGFAIDAAQKTGVTPRTIQQEVQIATRISDEVKGIIRQTPLADSKTDLVVKSDLLGLSDLSAKRLQNPILEENDPSVAFSVQLTQVQQTQRKNENLEVTDHSHLSGKK